MRPGVLEPVDVRDVLVVECGKDSRFPPEPIEPFGIVCNGRQEHLDSDVATEFRIPGAIHLAHPARAEAGDDLVRT